MSDDRCRTYERFKALDAAYRGGDLDAVRAELGHPPDFPNCLQPFELAIGDYPLVSAITLSPISFIRELLDAGADPNYPCQDGFPSLIATLATDRRDSLELLHLLIERGADLAQRGHNDWTPLHYAVVKRDLAAIELLLARGADPAARTRIDDLSTPLEDAEAAGFAAGAEAMRRSMSRR